MPICTSIAHARLECTHTRNTMHVPRLLCLVAVARGEFDTPMLGFNTCNVGCGNATFPNAAWLQRAADVLVAHLGWTSY